MTIDVAIKHAEEVAEVYKKLLKVYENIDEDKPLFTEEETKCRLCAEEHRQLAEWLKDYKRLLEQEPVLDKIRAEIEGLTYYWCEVNPNSVIDDVLQIIDKYKAESEV